MSDQPRSEEKTASQTLPSKDASGLETGGSVSSQAAVTSAGPPRPPQLPPAGKASAPSASGRPAPPVPANADLASEAYDPVSGSRVRGAVLRQVPGWLVSTVVHVVILVTLALVTLQPKSLDTLTQLVVAPGTDEKLEDPQELEKEFDRTVKVFAPNEKLTLDPVQGADDIQVAGADDVAAAAVSVPLDVTGIGNAPTSDLLTSIGAFSGDAFSGRGTAKARLLAQGGGSAGSEKAVAAALKWLAAHQLADGGWSFNHASQSSCHGQCRDPGKLTDARIAATALALLPFLGAGQTHKEGIYRSQVKGGLYFLINHIKVGPEGGSLIEAGGNMYSHGIASICLCEAYAMTHDKSLYGPVKEVITFICYAQDTKGGGWRYRPRQPGDTSVVGWQLMALKSAHMAYVPVPMQTFQKASHFLDTVQSNGGANYGYTTSGEGAATTAIGLLSRMYLGWKHDNQALERGVHWLSEQGPSTSNMYYDYYATQVMHHWGGEPWRKWNSVMRDELVSAQATRGHEAGSWYMQGDGHNRYGGRLYCTAMATMILEVYYRHLPIYREKSTKDEFPLD